jgi:hypothetical protein
MPGFGRLAFNETADLAVDGNLHWSVGMGAQHEGAFLPKDQQPPPAWFEESKKIYPPGWTAHDVFGDPKFVDFTPAWTDDDDLRIEQGSPAVNAGVSLSEDWPDPLRSTDAGKPDLGALPLGTETWGVGVRGRFSMFGERSGPTDSGR